MTHYKSIFFTVDFEVSDAALSTANNYLSKQPEPNPYVELHSEGYVFNFHTLDITLLKRNIQELTGTHLISNGNSSDIKQSKDVLQVIYDEVGKIGSYGIKSGKRQYVDYNIERKVKNRKVKEVTRARYYYAQDNGFSEENNELPQQFRDQIICGNS